MAYKSVGLVGLWDCVAFDEVAGITFKDKDGVQIMKDYMASGSFARGKEQKAASASMVFVGNINGEFSKEDMEEIITISLELRRRVKEQLKKIGSMEFYDVNFSYINNETFEEH